ncbi:bromodomain-containing protein 1-like isoform X1 [Centropristis striata]|uniref:bromodomain-containing protein 1-like isoform X1 n=1 Tax=Centropristis striata TaxID=184440 RepID=UPI0027DECD12|nr:bromodomain-containing protein 1-like isoform X1 [Centropristis striata]
MKKKSRHHRPAVLKRDSSPIKPSPNRETLTYAQAQRIVELEVDGRVHRLSIYDKLDVISDDDPTAQEIMECNSNKENNEKPQQVLVRSVRLKNNQQKKNASLVASQGTGTHGSNSGLLEAKVRTVEYNLPVVPKRPAAYYKYTERTAEELDDEVEYDMDEEDYAWLELFNEKRKSDGISQVSHNLFEFLMDRFEKESYSATQGQSDLQSLVDEDAVCCICMDGDGADSNVILFCDSCNIAVHQECYGVPYIPEGQWLCRHCLQCPSRPAECIFCPNRGGALKKTDDDRWGHVACALWVPEVGFSDTVFIEPIDGVRNIPPARWKLTCYLCKEKGAGACIQCDKINCYTAFHVSCAQKAGLYMKMEPVKEVTSSGAATFSVKKTAYCCSHTPEGCDCRQLNIYEEPHPKNGACIKRNDKRGKSRAKGWHKKKSKRAEPEPEPEPETPNNTGPSITASSFDTILNQVAVQRKRVFVERVLSYWVQKRLSRNNVPLIRRLQANPQPTKVEQEQERIETNQTLKEQLKEWHRLRHDLERARLLLELIRKREKLKREEMKLQQSALEVQLTPFSILLRAVLSQLQEKDQYSIFAQPVNVKEVPDYLDHIKNPMDFSTMRKRIDAYDYRSLEEFEADFDLIIFNCMKYNAKDTFFYKAGQRMQDHGGAILRRARREAERIGFDFPSGLHLPEAPVLEPPPPFTWDEVDRLLTPTYRQLTPLEVQLKELLEKLDLSTAMKHSPSRSKRLKLLKKTIMEVRSEMSLKNSLRKLPPAPPEPTPPPTEPEEKPLPETPAEPCAPAEEKPLPLPTLELLTSLSQLQSPPRDSEPPPLKAVKPSVDRTPMELDGDTNTSTSVPADTPNGHAPEAPLPNGDIHTEASGACNRRNNVLFRKSKSISPQKTPKTPESAALSPPLGTKTFLSVVIPRLETLLLPKKRRRSSSADGEEEEDEESPIKRLGTGIANGFVVEDEEISLSPRLLEPRRRCASESSISSSGSVLCSTSTVIVSKSGKGRSPAARRSTVDDRSTLMTCIENGEFTKAAKISPDHGPKSSEDGVSATRGGASPAAAGRSQSRRTDAVQVRRETLPRPLLRQQAQLAMAS